MSKLAKSLAAAAGNAADAPGIEKFSTYLYDGTGSDQTISNGVDLAGEGGMVWIKKRTNSDHHILCDTERGINKRVSSNLTDAQYTNSSVTAFNADGFDLDSSSATNASTERFVSWTFRKEPKFFDVVTWSGNGVAGGREIAHNLGVVPGMIMVKSLAWGEQWKILHVNSVKQFHFDYASIGAVPHSQMFGNGSNYVLPSSTTFTLGTDGAVNGGGSDYIAYLFAHDTAADGTIVCGSYSGDGTTDGSHLVNLGWEPQYVLIKVSSRVGDWFIWDTMRGMVVGYGDALMAANSATQENATYDWISPDPRGFRLHDNYYGINGSGDTYIYMAIRAPMLVEPEDATDVFAIDEGNGVVPAYTSGFPVDMLIRRYPPSQQDNKVYSRLTGQKYLRTNTTLHETTDTAGKFDYNNDCFGNADGSGYYGWMFKRAKGFFDIVTYTGDNSTNHPVNHSLGVAPEMIWTKMRDASEEWGVYTAPTTATTYMRLNQPNGPSTWSAAWNDTDPTASVFTLGQGSYMNQGGYGYIAYLFASLAGVSKVGNYTGNGSNQNIDCGFSGGARFVLIKCTDVGNSAGNWYMWDTERGIVTGNDPHIKLNSDAAEVTSDDSIDPVSSGFTVNQVSATNINVGSSTYIFLAIA